MHDVLHFGSEAQVLEPREFRAAVKAAIAELRAIYAVQSTD